MTKNLAIGNRTFAADMVVFDKDGTLIDFNRLWHGIAKRATAALIDRAGLSSSIAPVLYEALGFDPITATSDPDGPLAAGPNYRIYGAAKQVLKQLGLTDEQSNEFVREAFVPVVEAEPVRSDIHATGDIRRLFSDLKSRGIVVAVATADVTRPTVAALGYLNVLQLVDETLCGDAPEFSTKPDPAALIDLAKRHGAASGKVVMVGDTIADMRMSRQAGVGIGVAVLTGAGTRQQLTDWSDCVIDSVDAIKTV